MIGMGDFQDDHWAASVSLTMRADGTGIWYGPTGMARVYRDDSSTTLATVHCGQTHTRSWDRRWEDRTIHRLARQFLADVGRRT